ncbi:TRAP transporter small permease subunit [Candidatus Parabeggiatoa sp. HSG14]|uniref:TRAP transporter small permease subunit n=1 Tax=Candidatus Parabeggiatoa sp. HSG14 TaxID=3055593 RepID=UPI0025A70187|nr:TRAP transporter small permease subunit [Thiotrichales bacterium HSG14]
MPSQLITFIKSLIRFINAINEWTGRLIAWLILLIVLIIIYQTSMVALFAIGSVSLQELQWHLFALIFLLGAAYTLKHDDHVRVDIIYQSHWISDRGRAWIDFLGGLLFLVPFCVLIIITSWSFVSAAVTYQVTTSTSWPFISVVLLYAEGSPDPGGLPYRFLLKAAIPIGFILLMLQGIANSLTNLLFLLGIKEGRT